MAGVKTGKVKTLSAPSRPSFALGTRPPALRSEPIKRIKPMNGVTDYAKAAAGNPPNVAGAGFDGMLGPNGER